MLVLIPNNPNYAYATGMRTPIIMILTRTSNEEGERYNISSRHAGGRQVSDFNPTHGKQHERENEWHLLGCGSDCMSTCGSHEQNVGYDID